ncbi:hypothetical protein ACOSP7_023682 [Xanthoceras sorbifolium]
MFLLHSSRSFEYICFSKCSSNRAFKNKNTNTTEADDHPKIYRIKLWPANKLKLKKVNKVKKNNGQVRNASASFYSPLIV